VLEFDESRTVAELCDFAAEARQLPDLLVPSHRTPREAVRRMIYYQRLKSGRRDAAPARSRTPGRRNSDEERSLSDPAAEGIDTAGVSR
jgi:hypothetical protein